MFAMCEFIDIGISSLSYVARRAFTRVLRDKNLRVTITPDDIVRESVIRDAAREFLFATICDAVPVA